MQCPICKGKGEVDSPKNTIQEAKMKAGICRRMRKKGYTFREIMYMVGYKSPNSITKIIKK